MATTDPHLGRKHYIGLGIETTPGTAVAPQAWFRWMDRGFQPKTTVIENESAMGVVEKVNDSAVVESWAEGPLGGKVTEVTIGYLLLAAFGTVNTVDNGDGTFTHTFSVNQSALPKAMTVVRKNPLLTQRHPRGTLDNLELSAEAGSWVMASTVAKAWAGVTSTDTPAFDDELELTSKHVTVELADDVPGLAAPTALVSARSMKNTFERESTPFFPLGEVDQPEFDRGVWEAKGELVLRYTRSDIEEDYLSNKIHAMRTSMINGTFKLVTTATKVRFRELDTPTERDEIVQQTVGCYYELDTATGSTVTVALTNSHPAYVAAP